MLRAIRCSHWRWLLIISPDSATYHTSPRKFMTSKQVTSPTRWCMMSFCPWICTYCIDHITQKWRTLKVMYWKVIGFLGGPYRFTAFRACPMSFSTPPYWIGLRLFWPWLIWNHHLPWEPTVPSFLEVISPICLGLKTLIFHGFWGSKVYNVYRYSVHPSNEPPTVQICLVLRLTFSQMLSSPIPSKSGKQINLDIVSCKKNVADMFVQSFKRGPFQL